MPVDLLLDAAGWLRVGDRRVRCATGRGGIGVKRREGDGRTPVGRFPLRACFYRPDRLEIPHCGLTTTALRTTDGWCDDPAHTQYNRLIKRPFAAGHEVLWRSDGLYDALVVVGFNDAPVVPGVGSAIFIHVASPDYAPTQGCIGLERADLIAILALLEPGSRLIVSAREISG